MLKGCSGVNSYIWVYEFGYFFFLFYIFLGWEGMDYSFIDFIFVFINGWWVEWMDGGFCGIVGDGFCDMLLDYLSYWWLCNIEGLSNVQ